MSSRVECSINIRFILKVDPEDFDHDLDEVRSFIESETEGPFMALMDNLGIQSLNASYHVKDMDVKYFRKEHDNDECPFPA